MNKGYDAEEIAKIKELCRKAGQNFIYNEEEENDENAARIFFVGNYNGQEVIFDAFIYTLEMEYTLNIYDVAEAILMAENPKLKKEDFEKLEGKLVEELDALAEQISFDSDFDVQEFIQYDESADYGVGLDVCLNWKSVTKERIEKFIDEFNKGTFQLDKTFYSFSLSGDE
ncbi:MAG: hypothetical protein NZM38_10475 [Cytophagales bacterium]|nr:hypothetical protein [Cytophagales bacterium]MDW8385179.1 hypothetical protein [Flammeovirgaceae bacterium]